MSSSFLQLREACGLEHALECLVGNSRVCDCHFPSEMACHLSLAFRTASILCNGVELLIHVCIHSAYEEARHRTDSINLLSLTEALFHRRQIGFHDLPVSRNRKEQRDVDIDAFS